MLKELEIIKKDILASIDRNAPIIGIRNPMIGAGEANFSWLYPDDYFWTDSFWTGQLWMAYMLTGKQELKNIARMRYPHFEKILENPLWLNHDLGFEFSLTAVADYKLTGNKEAKRLALRAADALRSRFNYNGNYIVAWTAGSEGQEHAERVQGKIIIDCMQNLSLLLWAYSETNIDSYRHVAIAHAESTIKHIIRADYSTYHTFDFDTKTNEPIHGCTHQGYSDESCWSRGQAWAIHGFAQLALMTGELRYAEISSKLMDYVLNHISGDLVPVWDYLLPKDEAQYKDTSAGSITSAGLFILAEVFNKHGDHNKADFYENYALKMLLALRENYDLTLQKDAQGLLSNSASNVPKAQKDNKPYLANAMLPYGDYYYFEAVMRSLGHNNLFW